jgi:hypothetical protein
MWEEGSSRMMQTSVRSGPCMGGLDGPSCQPLSCPGKKTLTADARLLQKSTHASGLLPPSTVAQAQDPSCRLIMLTQQLQSCSL